MLNRFLWLLAILFQFHTAHAQTELPVLKSNSNTVQIMDGGKPMKGTWTLDPTVELDIYNAIRSGKPKTITFKTEIDSKSFNVEPGNIYDFVILPNGKDACRTRISTLTQGYERIKPSTDPVTIPITLEHGKLLIRGRINDSEMLSLIFDTGADTCVMYPSAKSKGATLKFDSTVLNAGSGGETLRQLSRDNRLEIADVRWKHEPFIFVEKQADHADGIVGYPVFEDKIVEIDYDRMVMIIHDSLPAHAKSFTKTAMPYSGTLPAIEVGMTSGDKSSGEKTWGGPFILDTAGTGTMIVNQGFAAAHAMHSGLRKVGSGVSRGVGSATTRLNLLMLPKLTIGGHTLIDVPIYAEVPPDGRTAPHGGVLCMEVLQRFNTILDFPNNEAYFKPNTLFPAPFKTRNSGPPMLLAVAVAVIVAVVVGITAYRRIVKRAALPASNVID